MQFDGKWNYPHFSIVQVYSRRLEQYKYVKIYSDLICNVRFLEIIIKFDMMESSYQFLRNKLSFLVQFDIEFKYQDFGCF